MTQLPSRPAQSGLQVLCLAGFMGSGKTTVGTLLARQLAWRFVDLDERIEESAGLRIPEIFERLGEGTFRQMEADQLRAALGRAVEHTEAVVLALGAERMRRPARQSFFVPRAFPSSGWTPHPIFC